MLFLLFWYNIKYMVFNVKPRPNPTYLNVIGKIINSYPTGVYFTLVKKESDVDELKESIDQYMKKQFYKTDTNGIIYINKFNFNNEYKTVDDCIHDNYILPFFGYTNKFRYNPTDRMDTKDKYLLFFNNVDMENIDINNKGIYGVDVGQYGFFHHIAQHSYDYGKYYGIVPVYDKSIYLKMLEINGGAKIVGFDREEILYKQQSEIYRRLNG